MKIFPFARYKPTAVDKLKMDIAQKREWMELHIQESIKLKSEIADLTTKLYVIRQKG